MPKTSVNFDELEALEALGKPRLRRYSHGTGRYLQTFVGFDLAFDVAVIGGWKKPVDATLRSKKIAVEFIALSDELPMEEVLAGRGGRRIYEQTVTNVGSGAGMPVDDQEAWDITAGHLAPRESLHHDWKAFYKDPEPFWSDRRESKVATGFPDGKGRG